MRSQCGSAIDQSAQATTLLVVEDNHDLRELLKIILTPAGFRAFYAASGWEALQIWDQHKDEIVLLLTDVTLPGGLSGFGLAERLTKERPGLKTIFCSGSIAEDAPSNLDLREHFNFLPKPYRPAHLLEIVRSRLRDVQGR